MAPRLPSDMPPTTTNACTSNLSWWDERLLLLRLRRQPLVVPILAQFAMNKLMRYCTLSMLEQQYV